MFCVVFNNFFTIIFISILAILSYFAVKKLINVKRECFVKCYSCKKFCNGGCCSKNIKK